MTFFCPKCWREIPPRREVCPHCGAHLAEEDAKPFIEKLRSALRHRESETAIRAAWILGERREVSAVADLIGVLETSRDGFLVETPAEALGKIGDERALPPLERPMAGGPVRVREACRVAIKRIRRHRHRAAPRRP